MPDKPQKLIAVVGPTSSGKTALSIALAKALGGEVISADSRQLYKGLNLGTGKATKREMRGVPHHLLSIASPKRQLSVDDFVKKGRRALALIYQNKKVPIVAGGTGLYVDALVGRLAYPSVPPNQALRAKLEKKSLAQLMSQLKKLDPARAKTVEPHHKRRMIRAIEVALGLRDTARARALRAARPSLTLAANSTAHPSYDVLWLGLYPGEQRLRENIRKRLKARLKAGMITEARRLHAQGLSYKRMEELGLEYRFMARYLKGSLSKAEMEEALERAIARYAKRQMRWFKRNKSIRWVAGEREALKLARQFVGGR